jgi:hypothetical protein
VHAGEWSRTIPLQREVITHTHHPPPPPPTHTHTHQGPSVVRPCFYAHAHPSTPAHQISNRKHHALHVQRLLIAPTVQFNLLVILVAWQLHQHQLAAGSRQQAAGSRQQAAGSARERESEYIRTRARTHSPTPTYTHSLSHEDALSTRPYLTHFSSLSRFVDYYTLTHNPVVPLPLPHN